MRNLLTTILSAGVLLATGAAFGQTPAPSTTVPPPAAAAKLEFDVATVKPSGPLDVQKLSADMQAGKMPNFGIHISGLRAEYNYVTMKTLIASAYKVKEYQVTGPAWLGTDHFDIVARMPDGSSKDDAPAMLRALLADRFKLVAHAETQEHPVLALVVAKGGSKLKESPAAAPAPIDEDAPLKSGEMKMNGPDGPIRVTTHPDGTITENMGAKGTATIKMDGGTMHMATDTMTMSGFADLLTNVMQMGGTGRQVVDMTELKGNYQVAVDISMADMMAAARAQGVNIPGMPAGGAASADASDPGGGGSTVFGSVEKLGLKLEQRKAPVEQVVVDSMEKTATEN